MALNYWLRFAIGFDLDRGHMGKFHRVTGCWP